MNYIKTIENYFSLNNLNFVSKFKSKRLNFVKKNLFLYDEISDFINVNINKSKVSLFFCFGNSVITKNVKSENKYIHDPFTENIYIKKNIEEIINKSDHIIVADLEYQKNILKNFEIIEKNINDDAKIIILSKSQIWATLIYLMKKFFNFAPKKNNLIPFNYLAELVSVSNLEIIKNNKIIFFPFKIPLISNFLNKLFRLPILNWFCFLNISIIKKKKYNKKNISESKISFIIPCKNEEGNIKFFKNKLKNFGKETEFLFGDDNSRDNTLQEIKKLKAGPGYTIKDYNGGGICKSNNVYTGIELAKGDIIVIFDADFTVTFESIQDCLVKLTISNSDFINCSRMIYPQEKNAMKKFNYFGNLFFAFLFSIIFNKNITDTLCGTKIFYKKDWIKIKSSNAKWGEKDLWGDFDLLLGAYKNNLKITELPITYYERLEGQSKMTSVLNNALRMFKIVIFAFYKLKVSR